MHESFVNTNSSSKEITLGTEHTPREIINLGSRANSPQKQNTMDQQSPLRNEAVKV